MSFYDDASLVFLPSGGAGKDTKAYSIKPTNGDGDFTFSRGSNLTATRIDSNGLIEKGRENLLLQSNSFDTTWATSNASVTSGQSGYDGSNDAWLLEATGTSSTRVQQTISTDSVQTISVYAKKGTSDYFQIRLTGASTAFAFFDLANGTLGTLSNQVDASITSIGSGWYRCSLTRIGASTSARIYVTGNNTTSVSVGDNIYIQDAQLEIGLTSTEYIESGASTGLAGILEDSPRFDYSGGASCPSLLLEPSRTNLIGYSEYIEGNTSQGFTNATKEGFTESPEGLNNAYEINVITPNENAAWDLGRFNTNIGADYTYSVYLKSSGTFDARIYASRGTTEIKNIVVTSEWQRFDLTFTSDNTDKDLIVGFGDFNFANPAQTISIYGLQLEQASYPTSYIPNHSGGSVTREEDTTAELSLSSSYGSSNTWFFELKRITDTSLSNQSIAILKNDSTGASNRFTIYSTSGGRFRVLLSDENGTTENLFSPSDGFEKGETIKAAVKITSSGCTLFVDGSSVATSSSVGTITGIDTITYFKKAALKQFLIFPTALSDGECIILTS